MIGFFEKDVKISGLLHCQIKLQVTKYYQALKLIEGPEIIIDGNLYDTVGEEFWKNYVKARTRKYEENDEQI